MNQAGIERVRSIARELETVGRREDADLLAQLATEVEGGQHRVSVGIDDAELDRRLIAAEADITNGRLTPDTAVWAQIDADRLRKRVS